MASTAASPASHRLRVFYSATNPPYFILSILPPTTTSSYGDASLFLQAVHCHLFLNRTRVIDSDKMRKQHLKVQRGSSCGTWYRERERTTQIVLWWERTVSNEARMTLLGHGRQLCNETPNDMGVKTHLPVCSSYKV